MVIKRGLRIFLCAAVMAIFAVSADAMVISGGANTGPSSYGWDYTVKLSTGTGVYLGNGWVLTAYHVYDDKVGQSVSFANGSQYNEIMGLGTRVDNADLALFYIGSVPGLAPLTIKTDSITTPPSRIAQRSNSCHSNRVTAVGSRNIV